MKQVEENVLSASTSGLHSLRTKELQLVERAKKEFRARTVIPCTKCGYCML